MDLEDEKTPELDRGVPCAKILEVSYTQTCIEFLNTMPSSYKI